MTITAPIELAARPQWVAWRLERRDNRDTKVPYNARTGARASSTDPHTWATFEEACAYCARDNANGVGYVLSPEDPYVGIDLDHCRDPHSGRIDNWAKDIVRRLNSYTEISPSGTGLRIFIRGTLPPHGRRKGQIEIYSQARFLTITGEHVLFAPTTIQDRSTELLAWHEEIFGLSPDRRQNGHQNGQVLRSPVQLADADLLLKARNAANGGAFWALWNGDYSAYTSESEATLALLNHLAFWTGPDSSRLDGLFRSSGLMRDKWDERRGSSTWGQLQIDKALEGRTEFYSPESSSPRLVVNADHVVDAVTGEVTSVGAERRFKFLTAAELKNRPAPEYVIDNVLQQNTVAMLVGAQETYKSFVGLDMAMSTAAGIDWAGHPTKQGVTAYISAEGGSGLGLRIAAWEKEHGPVEHCYFLADQAPQFLDRKQGGDVEELLLSLAALPEKPALIFVDTLARTMVGGDENSAQDMGLFIASAEQIRQSTGATVVLVHHNNKEGSARGSSSLLGAVHTIIECSREKNSTAVIVKCGKQKDSEHFDIMAFQAQQIVVDNEGRTSLVMKLQEQTRLQVADEPSVTRAGMVALDALATLITATFIEWRERSGLAATTFRTVRAELLKADLVDHIGDKYSLSSLGQMFRAKKGQTGAIGPNGPGATEGPFEGAPPYYVGGRPNGPSSGPSPSTSTEGPDSPW